MTLNLRLRKIIRDLWGNKPRTLLVILTIAIGAMAVATISRGWFILSQELEASYLAINPASALIFTTNQTFDDNVVDTIRNMPEIAEAEGLREVRMRVQEDEETWGSLVLVALPDFDDNAINQLRIEEGTWPPPNRSILLERSAINLIDAEVGDTLMVQTVQGKTRALTISGIVHHLHQSPSVMSLLSFGYVTPDTYQQLTGDQLYNELEFVVAENRFDKEHITRVTELVSEKLEDSGLFVTDKFIPEPGRPPLDGVIRAASLILWALSVLALLLSMLLVINTISALLSQQVQQIGTLKAVGAETGHIIVMYAFAIFLFGLVALLIAVPFGSFVGRAVAVFIATLLNFDVGQVDYPLWIYLLDIFACLVMPLLAAMYPILSSTRITVREAMGRAGSSSNFGTGTVEKLLRRLGRLPGPIRYSLRNMFRNKIRLLLVMITLTLAGAIFIAVISVQSSLDSTVAEVSAYWQEDVSIRFPTSQRTVKIEQILAELPDITDVEERLSVLSFRVKPDGSESDQTIELFGVKLPSQYLEPTVQEGRWLTPDDENSIVLDISFAAEEPDVKVGDEVVLKIEGRETVWKVVGVVGVQVVGTARLLAPVGYVNYDPLAKLTRDTGRANRTLVSTTDDSPDFQLQSRQVLENHFQNIGVSVTSAITNAERQQALGSLFGVLTNVLLLMTVFFAVVGGIGLTNMMSLNVLERTTEIGIVRVIGGEHSDIRQIVIVEGISIGIFSWLFGLILAIPLSIALSDNIGWIFLRQPLTYTYSFSGVLWWLIIVIILSLFASLLPAQRASQISVRESLTYE